MPAAVAPQAADHTDIRPGSGATDSDESDADDSDVEVRLAAFCTLLCILLTSSSALTTIAYTTRSAAVGLYGICDQTIWLTCITIIHDLSCTYPLTYIKQSLIKHVQRARAFLVNRRQAAGDVKDDHLCSLLPKPKQWYASSTLNIALQAGDPGALALLVPPASDLKAWQAVPAAPQGLSVTHVATLAHALPHSLLKAALGTVLMTHASCSSFVIM